jgi:hypothetical protein
VFSQPFNDTTAQYVFVQPWMVLAANFPSTAIGTAHPVLSTYYLAEEGERQQTGPVVRWNRTYVAKPATRYVPQMFSYPFIGYWGLTGINVENVTGRERQNRPCLSRVKYEYFRIAASGGDYTSDTQIPILYAQKYYFGTPNVLVDYIADAPPFVAATTPSRTTYESWIADAQANVWNATIGQIVGEDCTIDRWMGPIWFRATRYILAQ